MSYLDQPLRQFIEDLAARTPTPGGGSASALLGALGAALGNMAAAFTTGNDKFKAVEPAVARLNEKLAALRARFAVLLNRDIEAYNAYAAARNMPKNTLAAKQARSAALRAAKETATAVPEEITVAAREGLQLAVELSALANPSLASDLAAAAYCLEAAARGAGIQVLCNCAAADREGRNAMRRTAVLEIIQQCQASRRRIHTATTKMLGV
jgi:formiminotetrahydrofolate cyclodeaminase